MKKHQAILEKYPNHKVILEQDNEIDLSLSDSSLKFRFSKDKIKTTMIYSDNIIAEFESDSVVESFEKIREVISDPKSSHYTMSARECFNPARTPEKNSRFKFE